MLKRSGFTLTLVLTCALVAFGQAGGYRAGATNGAGGVPTTPIANISNFTAFGMVIVTDANTSSTCTVNGGSFHNVCYWNGSTWGTVSGSASMVYPAAGVALSNGSGWLASLTAPTTALVGIADTQTLTNKTVDGVTPATFAFLDPTSSIQAQLNAKAASNASITISGVLCQLSGTCSIPYSGLAGTPALFYQTLDANSVAETQRAILNLIAGTNMTVTCVDNAVSGRTDCTFAASATGATAFSALTASANSNAGTFSATGNTWDFTGTTIFKLRAGAGATSSANGDLAYDTSNHNWHLWNGADSILAPLAAGFTSGDCGQPTNSAGEWTIADSGSPCGSGGSLPSGVAGQVPTNTGAGAGTYSAQSPSLPLGNGGALVSLASANYTILCDSATVATGVQDRGKVIKIGTVGANDVIIPDLAGSGCSGMYGEIENGTSSTITVSRQTSDTFNVFGPAQGAPTTAATTFTLAAGQWATYSPSESATAFDIRAYAPSISGSGVPNPAANGIVICTGTSCSTSATRTLTGTPNQVAVTNGDGTGGNPTIAFPSTIVIPTGSTATTPGANDNSTKVATTAYVDTKAPLVSLSTTTPVTVSTTATSAFYNNQNATAATAVTYNLPTAAAGKQFCFTNSFNGTAADTGVLTLQTSATGQFVIFTDGTLSATDGNVTSGGAASDAACVVGVDATHWQLYVQRGTWTKH